MQLQEVSPSVMPTVGAIARRLGVDLHRVEYVIKSRQIRPAARAGNTRVFSEGDVAYIASELDKAGAGRGHAAGEGSSHV